ncbi:MAG: isocitrate lyase/phosphoenolpyruvate mutase family protein [Roseibium sp.]|uniref:isocitrate lyase/phosphoenolpyruvate mutase family protein n=1 Tax=Roseibium sp. TaxID=1936156 RepID=UPI0026039CC3|nr:isocitrate lyase/phosphoenolpyruvate mutase family protein [Roseibium sp.]MCV0429293.1 isocitrate lyase/phosphoenolpyruvate mutase family protein [Roseibium sp.]
MPEAKEREAAFADSGADGFFVPGLTDTALISSLVEAATLPVNVMMMGNLKLIDQVAALGVCRISFGPAPFLAALADMEMRLKEI